MRLLLILLAIGILVMLIRSILSRRKAKEESGAAEEELSLDNLGPGGILSITDTDYLVESKNRYQAGNSEWYEVQLTGDGGETWWLNWEPGAREVTLTTQIPFQDLAITPEDLEEFVAEGQGEVTYEGETYYLAEFGEADYYRGDSTVGEELAYCDFYTEDERKTLGIVQWASGAIDAYAGIVIPLHQVEVLRNRGEEDEDWT